MGENKETLRRGLGLVHQIRDLTPEEIRIIAHTSGTVIATHSPFSSRESPGRRHASATRAAELANTESGDYERRRLDKLGRELTAELDQKWESNGREVSDVLHPRAILDFVRADYAKERIEEEEYAILTAPLRAAVHGEKWMEDPDWFRLLLELTEQHGIDQARNMVTAVAATQ